MKLPKFEDQPDAWYSSGLDVFRGPVTMFFVDTSNRYFFLSSSELSSSELLALLSPPLLPPFSTLLGGVGPASSSVPLSWSRSPSSCCWERSSPPASSLLLGELGAPPASSLLLEALASSFPLTFKAVLAFIHFNQQRSELQSRPKADRQNAEENQYIQPEKIASHKFCMLFGA